MITKIQIWHTYGKGSGEELYKEIPVTADNVNNIIDEDFPTCHDVIDIGELLAGKVYYFDNFGGDWDDPTGGFVCAVEVPQTYNEHIFALSKEITEKCQKIDTEFRMEQGQAMKNVFSNALF